MNLKWKYLYFKKTDKIKQKIRTSFNRGNGGGALQLLSVKTEWKFSLQPSALKPPPLFL